MKLEQAFKLLQDAHAVSVNDIDDVLTHHSLSDSINNEDDNEFLHLCFEIDGEDYSLTFREEENLEVEIGENSMTLVDTEGDEHTITLLFTDNLNTRKVE